ncbi:MAG: UTP--glucose-1-phosphate uridylyltransferase GalU [Burkholderiaceae bacterium]|nr:UTP--glucose-1-phosphate uridylyltransferase GalU [Burkholderiaceae bacterium]MEB2350732.1 UTP--glucose-1-phosphate uridylyltransferase GalU [Burkholderiaceae bacterium]
MNAPNRRRVSKAVFPVAGLGTRFLPATKAQPKEMLPVVDKPLIQYAVEEAAAAGITDMIFITGRGKRSIEDHFDKAYELESELALKGKTELLAQVWSTTPKDIHCIYVRQAAPLGLGHAVRCARDLIGDEPFAVLLADDLMQAPPQGPGVLAQMVDLYERTGSSVVAVQDVAREETAAYGIVSTDGAGPVEGSERIVGIVEKPSPERAPSTLAVVGRYVLSARAFEFLDALQPGASGEMQLTDALNELCAAERMLAWRYRGKRFDCGSKLGYLQATVELGLGHPEVGQPFADYLAGLTACVAGRTATGRS